MLYKNIEKIINEWDPINLFPYSPSDEYRIEIERINGLCRDEDDEESLAKIIYKIFIDEFGEDVFRFDMKKCESIAKLILQDDK